VNLARKLAVALPVSNDARGDYIPHGILMIKDAGMHAICLLPSWRHGSLE